MKTILYMVLVLLLDATLFSYDNNTSYQQDQLTRIEMVRQARVLTKEYNLVENKLEVWMIRKQKLIDDFEQQHNEDEVLPLGQDNDYGMKRLLKRKLAFYRSLQVKEKRIKNRLFRISSELNKIKNDFLFLYAVPLTDDEIFKGKRPKIVDKDKKIKILGDYLKYLNTYKMYKKRNEKYDQVKYLMANIEKVNDKEEKFDANITREAEANATRMFQYKAMSDKLAEEFYNQYGISIYNPDRAEQFLHNIKKQVYQK